MHYVDEGSGPVLLMLHGNPTWSFDHRTVELSGASHYIQEEAPEEIVAAIREWWPEHVRAAR